MAPRVQDASQIRQVMITEAFPFMADQIRASGREPFFFPGKPWDGGVSSPYDVVDDYVTIESHMQKWLHEDKSRAHIDMWGAWRALSKYCRSKRIPYIGVASEVMDGLEERRRSTRKLLQRRGFGETITHAVNTPKERDAFVIRARREWEQCGRLYVIKADYDMREYDYFKVIVPENFSDFEWALTRFDVPLSLEERVSGVEVAFTVMVIDGQTIIPLHTNFEHKKSHDGNMGVPAGEVGTLILRGIAPKVMSELFDPLRPLLRRERYNGYLDINCIYNPDTRILHLLEFTVRFGCPTHCIFSEMVEDMGSLMLEWACQNPIEPTWTANAAVGVLVVPGGFPHAEACRQHIPCEIGPFQYGNFHRMNISTHPVWGYEVTGGRLGVFGVGASTVAEARARLYQDVTKIEFEDFQYRTDIGAQWTEWRDTLLDAGYITSEQAEF